MANIKEMTTAELKAELNRLELEVVKDDSTQHSLKILLNS